MTLITNSELTQPLVGLLELLHQIVFQIPYL